ncbi:hypothetical protein EDB89DRAFT_1911226 [Lactarius sanguifluus]|nr:hypothetical protein EDB89DRAFT_1911226 [Lactarius sanguifluus]
MACRPAMPPQHGTQDPGRQPITMPSQHGMQDPTTSDPPHPLNDTAHKTPPPPTRHITQDPDHQPTTTPPQCGMQDPATADPPRHPITITSAPTIPPNHHADNCVQAPLVDRPNTLHPNPIPMTASQSPSLRLHSSLTVVLVYVHLF